jgi:dipeptide/tripeptide permease
MAAPPASADAPQEGLLTQLAGLDNRFWIVNVMEMFERLAYYGVRAVAAIYMVLPLSMGGPEFTHVQKGTIFAAWAAVQSLLPMFTGGFADRYGHKRTIAVAIAFKVVGYLMMAHFMDYGLFFGGCVMLAAGTAIFKPGVQGTLAATLKKSSASIGWGVFYQLVNIGGFLGPVIAGVLRQMDWIYVFYACAAIVSVNYLWLPFYKDPTQEMDASAAEAQQTAGWASLSQAVPQSLAFRWAAFFAAVAAAWPVALWGGAALLAGGEQAWWGLALGLGGLALTGAVALVITPLRKSAWLILVVALLAELLALEKGLALPAIEALKASANPVAGFLATLGFAGQYLAPTGCGLGALLYWFGNHKDRYDLGRGDPLSVLVVSAAGLFQHRVLWFCIVFSGFWLMFNQVFDLLPNVIDDWVDSSGLIRLAGESFSTPVVPGVLALAGGVVFAFVCGGIVLLATRPDHRVAADVPQSAWVVVGIGITMAAGPALSQPAGMVAALVSDAGFAGTPLPNLAALGMYLAVVGVVAVIGRLVKVPGKYVAVGAFVLALPTTTWFVFQSLQASSAELMTMAANNAQVPPEWMINVNPGLITFTMVGVAWLSSKMRPLTSIIVGMVVATAGSVLAGTATVGVVTLAGIAVFSVGEMLSSPKKMEYLATLSRPGQEGLFMGYANIPVAIGWIAGSIFAGNAYEEGGDKVNLARRYLVETQGWTESAAEGLERAAVVERLAAELGSSAPEVQQLLFTTYQPQALWIQIGVIGLLSIVGMMVYDRVIRHLDGGTAKSK